MISFDLPSYTLKDKTVISNAAVAIENMRVKGDGTFSYIVKIYESPKALENGAKPLEAKSFDGTTAEDGVKALVEADLKTRAGFEKIE